MIRRYCRTLFLVAPSKEHLRAAEIQVRRYKIWPKTVAIERRSETEEIGRLESTGLVGCFKTYCASHSKLVFRKPTQWIFFPLSLCRVLRGFRLCGYGVKKEENGEQEGREREGEGAESSLNNQEADAERSRDTSLKWSTFFTIQRWGEGCWLVEATDQLCVCNCRTWVQGTCGLYFYE